MAFLLPISNPDIDHAISQDQRQKFNRLIEKVTVSRKKPYAILVYKMSRFSRSGGNAIGLINHLVEELGVHLIEVSSGISTYMVDYCNKKKQLHYYHCLCCSGVSLNAATTKRAQRKEANELFMAFLDKYRLPDGLAFLVEKQLVKIFDHYNAGQAEHDMNFNHSLQAWRRH